MINLFHAIGIVLVLMFTSQVAFSEEFQTNTIKQYGENPQVFIKNPKDHNSLPGVEVGGYYLRSGNNGTKYFISYFTVDTSKIPQTDLTRKLVIDSVELGLLANFAENSSQKYSTTVGICVDGFENEILNIARKEKNDQFFTSNYYDTSMCRIVAPQDTVVIDRNDLPKLYGWDVTGVTSFLLEKKVSSILFVVTSIPIDENKQIDYYKLPESSTGLVSFISFADVYGVTSTPTFTLKYSYQPTDLQIIYSSLITIWPIIAIILGPIVTYYIGQRLGKTGTIKKLAKTLLTEIIENENSLNGKNGDPIREFTASNGTQVKYVHCYLDTDAYDSVVMSGQFTQFNLNTQNYLERIYTRIKDHNDDIKIRNEIEYTYHLLNKKIDENDVNVISEKFVIHLTDIEKEILELFPKVKISLNTEMKKKFYF